MGQPDQASRPGGGSAPWLSPPRGACGPGPAGRPFGLQGAQERHPALALGVHQGRHLRDQHHQGRRLKSLMSWPPQGSPASAGIATGGAWPLVVGVSRGPAGMLQTIAPASGGSGDTGWLVPSFDSAWNGRAGDAGTAIVPIGTRPLAWARGGSWTAGREPHPRPAGLDEAAGDRLPVFAHERLGQGQAHGLRQGQGSRVIPAGDLSQGGGRAGRHGAAAGCSFRSMA